MIRFECDYAEGAHPHILEALVKTNFEQTPGYGEDIYCERARRAIQKACGDMSVDVHFLVGGTQTNTTVIASILRPYQGVVCAETGHINVHETGAIEATGHKVLPLPSVDGKIRAYQVREAMNEHLADSGPEHCVQPGMVYISHPTENGTIYTKRELTELYQVCQELHLPLFVDGARLGYGLMASGNDLTLEEVTKLCDLFYIGGTKVGALFGEAVVISNETLKKDFRYMMKRHGGLLAKGRLLGIQFTTLFESGLYCDISKHAILMAEKIQRAFKDKGITFLYDSPTNQQFPILRNSQLDMLKENYAFAYWKAIDGECSAVRFCTSWATRVEDVEKLVEDIKRLESK